MTFDRKRIRKKRKSSGTTLVEALVALIVGSLIAGVLLDMFSKLQRVATTTQNEVSANAIAQETMESARSLDYDYLSNRIGLSYDLTEAGQNGFDMRTEPIVLDLINKGWDPKVISAKFPGNANLAIEAANGIPNAVKVTTTVSWSDSEKMGASGQKGRTIKTSIVITKSGLNRWTK